MPGATFAACDVLFANRIPALDDDEIKGRFVLVLEPPRAGARDGMNVVAVGITSRRPTDGTGVRLPDATKYPETKTGLDRPSWAVPSWLLTVPVCVVDRKAGYAKTSHVVAVQSKAVELGAEIKSVTCGDADCASCSHDRGG